MRRTRHGLLGALPWDDLDQDLDLDQSSKVTRIMVHQRNQWILDQNRFVGSYHASSDLGSLIRIRITPKERSPWKFDWTARIHMISFPMPRNKTVETKEVNFLCKLFSRSYRSFSSKGIAYLWGKTENYSRRSPDFFKRENDETIALQTSPKNKDFVWTG